MHRIVANPSSNMLDLRLEGFLTTSSVQAFEAELNAVYREGRVRPGYLLLVDIADLKAQSQETVAAMMKIAGTVQKAKRIAVLTGSSIVRLQLSRVMQQDYLRIVVDRAEALDWLMSEIEPRRAA